MIEFTGFDTTWSTVLSQYANETDGSTRLRVSSKLWIESTMEPDEHLCIIEARAIIDPPSKRH